MDNKLRLALVASTLQFWLASAVEHPAPICPTGLAYVQLQPVHVLVEKPVQLSAYIASNTTITVDETLTITVTDAPLVLVTELTQYETITSLAKSLCNEKGECLSGPGSTELGLSHSTSNPLVPYSGRDSSASALASPTKSSLKGSSVSSSSPERVNTFVSGNPTQDTTATASALEPGTETEQQPHEQTSQRRLSGQSSIKNSDNLATAGSVAGFSKAKTSIPTVPFSEDSTSTSYPQRQASSTPFSSTEDYRSQKNTNTAFEGSSTYSGRRSSSGLSPSSAPQSEQPGLSSLLSTLSKSTSLPSTLPENGAQTSTSLSPAAHPSFSTNASLDIQRSKTETATGYASEPPSSLTSTQYTTFPHKYVGPEPSAGVPQQTLGTSFEHAQPESASFSTLLASTLTSTAALEVSSASESGSTLDYVLAWTSSEELELPITSGQTNLYDSSIQNSMGPTIPSTAEPLTSSAVYSTDAELTSISSTTQSYLSSFRQSEQSSPAAEDKVESSTLKASEPLNLQRLKGSSTTSASLLASTSSEISKVSTTRNAPESTTALTDLESLTSPEPAKTSTGVRWPAMQSLEASNTTSLGTSTSTLRFLVTTEPLESTIEETSKTESELESSATSECAHEESSTAGSSVPTSSTSESGDTESSASESTTSGPETSESSTAESSTVELSTAEWSTAGPLATSSSTSESASMESLAFESTASEPAISGSETSESSTAESSTAGPLTASSSTPESVSMESSVSESTASRPIISGPETSESSSAESSMLSETAAPTPAKLPTASSLTPESSTIEPSTSTSTILESSVLWPTTAESSTTAITNLDSTTLESATAESSALASETTQSSIPEPPATSLSTDESLPTESSTSIPMTPESKISSTSTASMHETTPAARVPETVMSSDISKTSSPSKKIESSVASEPLWYSTSQVTTILSSSKPSETTSTTEIPMSQSTTADLGPDSQTDAQTIALTTTSLESSSITDLQTTTNPEVSTTTSSAANIATSEVGCISDADCNQDEVCDTDSRQCIVSKPDQSCGNAGLEYAVYDNPYYNSDILDYADFDVTHFHGATPLFEGITDRVGIAQGQNPYYPPIKVYDDSEVMFLQYKAISHVALLYAPYSGDYEISVPVSDEITLVWVGDKAISDWTRENADVEQRYHYETREPQVVRIHLEAGSYNNLRILWANGQGEFSFILSIKAPNGDVIVDGTESNTDYLVRFPCGDKAVL